MSIAATHENSSIESGSPLARARLLEAGWRTSEITQYLNSRPPGSGIFNQTWQSSGLSERAHGAMPGPRPGQRSSTRVFDGSEVAWSDLKPILAASFSTNTARPYALAGTVSGILCHVLARNLTLDSSVASNKVFRYEPESQSLELAGAIPFESLLEAVDIDAVRNMSVLVIYSLDLDRRVQYRNRYELGLIEVGQSFQLLDGAAAGGALGVCALGAVYPEAFARLRSTNRDVDLPEAPVLAVACGPKIA